MRTGRPKLPSTPVSRLDATHSVLRLTYKQQQLSCFIDTTDTALVAGSQRLRDIKATVIHYMTMLHVALNDDFGLDSLEIKGLVEKYYRLPPLPKS